MKLSYKNIILSLIIKKIIVFPENFFQIFFFVNLSNIFIIYHIMMFSNVLKRVNDDVFVNVLNLGNIKFALQSKAVSLSV